MAGITRRPLRAAQMPMETDPTPALAGPLAQAGGENPVHGAIQSMLLKMLMAKVGGGAGGAVDGAQVPALFQGF